MAYDVFGIENPLIDLLARVPEDFLARMGVAKNTMTLVAQERFQHLLGALEGTHIHAEPGGSCANTILGIAQLGGKTAFCGKAGGDAYGRLYVEKLRSAGVSPYISTNGHLTGSTIILITPDAQRSMNTYLGACQDLGPADVPLAALRDSRRLYITGYLWDTDGQQEAARLALRTAKAESIPVAMSLSDPFCVHRHKADFQALLREHVGLVFANREEALALTDTDNSQEALRALRGWCEGAVVTLGASGALIAEGGETVYVDAFAAKPVDTTGAGDAFAAGYLHGKSVGASPLQCGRLGAYFAAQVIQKVGPRLEGDVRAQLAPVLGSPRA
jgi:sugar/nucleoside kinase (ribokinase family)